MVAKMSVKISIFLTITRRHSEDLRNEFAHLDILRLHTIAKYGSEAEANYTKQELKSLMEGEGSGNQRKRLHKDC